MRTTAGPESPPGPPALELGEEAELGPVEAKALRYEPDVGVAPPGAVDRSDALLVEVCNLDVQPSLVDESLFASAAWALLDADLGPRGELVDAPATGAPLPAFPDRDLAVGECAKGWILFSVPRDVVVTRAAYTTDDLGGGFWFVGATRAAV